MTGAGPILLWSFAALCLAAAVRFLRRPESLPGGWRRGPASQSAARFVAGALVVTAALLGLAPTVIQRSPWRESALWIAAAGIVMLAVTALGVMKFGATPTASVDDGSTDPHNQTR